MITPVDNAGWHFGYLGNADQVIAKIEAFSHEEYNTEEFKNKAALQEKIRNGKDLFGRDLYYIFIPLDDSFPEYVLNNKDKFRHLIN
jgi:beta-1,4-mannosyl-glycoprotein beta-1,4-N-acetylglucosaminyltransferase